MKQKTDKYYYFILFNIFLLTALNPFFSPIILQSTDMQLPVFILAALIFFFDIIRNDLKLKFEHILILFFGFISIFYFLPDTFLYFSLNKRLSILLAFLIFYAFYKYIHLIDKNFFLVGALFNFAGVLLHFFFTDFFISIASNFVRVIKITEFTGRGASGFASEPLYAATMLFFICLLSKYLFIFKKIPKNYNIFIQIISVVGIILTKSATGYIYLIILFLFIYFSFSFISIIFKIISFVFLIILIDNLDKFIPIDNRGYYVIRDLLFSYEILLCDQSLFTRLHSILYGLTTLSDNLFGNGAGSSLFLDPRTVEISYNSNYNTLLYNNQNNILNSYFIFCKVFSNPVELIRSNIFMSNIGMYTYEYGIIFIIFLISIFLINFKFNYFNIMLLVSCFLMLMSSLSLSYPGIWIILAITKLRNLNEIE